MAIPTVSLRPHFLSLANLFFVLFNHDRDHLEKDPKLLGHTNLVFMHSNNDGDRLEKIQKTATRIIFERLVILKWQRDILHE